MNIKVKRLHEHAKLPSYAHPGDVGMDLYATEGGEIGPSERKLFFVGFAMEFPEGYAAIIKDKSGLSVKHGLHTIGGVFDAGFRGEYNVCLVNTSDTPYKVEKGDKVGQAVIVPVVIAKLVEVQELSDSSRGEGKFGSTGR